MHLDERLTPDKKSALMFLGYDNASPDETTSLRLDSAAREIGEIAAIRWTFAEFGIYGETDAIFLNETGLCLAGSDIFAHLEGCQSCILLALTLGPEVDSLIRSASALDMERAVLLDSCASALIEQYADLCEVRLRSESQKRGFYLTGRFSPGYGNLPISSLHAVTALLDCQRAIGLTVSKSGIMLPRKSITAVLGLADHPVYGRLAGCENCMLREKCADAGTGICQRRHLND